MGLLIAVEGSDFTGKTTIIVPALFKKLRQMGINVKTARDPGTTKRGEEIRKIIFKKIKNNVSTWEIGQLFYEARADLVKKVIIPHLGERKEKDAVIILDRYLDSSRVYQGFEGGIPQEELKKMDEKYLHNYYPDLTLILYLPLSKAAGAIKKRRQKSLKTRYGHSAWDSQNMDYHIKRQNYYLQLPELAGRFCEKREFAKIDASRGPQIVASDAISAVLHFILNPKYKISISAKRPKS